MPRQLRLQAPGELYHVTDRGTGGCVIFRETLSYEVFLAALRGVVVRFEWNCLAYCLLGTHYHLLLQPGGETLSEGMQRLNSAYAFWFNRHYGRYGHLFQGRFHSVPLRTDAHLVMVLPYLALNPVRAGLAESACSWPWSSYAATVGEAQAPRFLARDLALEVFGGRKRGLAMFRELVDVAHGAS
jgi:putative transposase